MQDLGNRNGYFVSDIHLVRKWGRNGETLLRFFDERLEDQESQALFLVGDIFDVWVADHQFFVNSFEPFVSKLSLLAEKMPVYYFEGNHDFHVGGFWPRYGVQVVHNRETFQLNGKVVRVEHGDFINPNDTTYLKWRETSRGPLWTFLAHNIPGRMWQLIADFWKSNNQKLREYQPLDRDEKVRQMIRTYAESESQLDEFDYLITGHMHVRDEYEFSGRYSINLGTWLKEPGYLLLDQGGARFIDL